MTTTVSKWATRFIWAAIIQGALATLLTLYIVIGQIFFPSTRAKPGNRVWIRG